VTLRALLKNGAQVVGPPFQIEGKELRISAKAGTPLFPNDGEEAETLGRTPKPRSRMRRNG